MVGDRLGFLELTAIGEVGRDAGATERVATNARGNPRRLGAPLDHPQSIDAMHPRIAQVAGAADRGAEQGTGFKLSGADIFVQIEDGVVVRWNLVELAAFFRSAESSFAFRSNSSLRRYVDPIGSTLNREDSISASVALRRVT